MHNTQLMLRYLHVSCQTYTLLNIATKPSQVCSISHKQPLFAGHKGCLQYCGNTHLHFHLHLHLNIHFFFLLCLHSCPRTHTHIPYHFHLHNNHLITSVWAHAFSATASFTTNPLPLSPLHRRILNCNLRLCFHFHLHLYLLHFHIHTHLHLHLHFHSNLLPISTYTSTPTSSPSFISFSSLHLLAISSTIPALF